MSGTDGHDRSQGGATLEAVARVAGVSRATVSRVVNESPRVSPDVRAAVESAIRQLGYTPNRAARSLVTRRSDSIAVVITEPTGRLFSDPFFPRLVRGVASELAARDLQLVLAHARARARSCAPRATSPAATSTARSSSASTATTRSRPPSPRATSRWCSSGGRRRART